MKKRGKKAEGFVGMGFGMIFSIFLIIFFVMVAFYAIKTFLDYKSCTQVGTFLNDLQSKITTLFNSQSSTINFPTNLPTGIKYICFANLSNPIKGSFQDIGSSLGQYGTDSNLYFYPREKACIKTKQINNINLSTIIKNDNPYCIPVRNGKITMKISKGFNQGLVTIS